MPSTVKLPVLLGMGYRIFSIAPVMIPYLAKVARETDMAQAKDFSQQVCQSNDSTQVTRILQTTIFPVNNDA